MTSEPLNVAAARTTLGRKWGLNRPLSRAELARALGLSPTYGGSHISKLENKTNPATLSGPIKGLIEAYLDGYRPRHMDDVVKPGYPRGEVTT